MIKYIFLNISKTKKLYIPFFIILTALLFSLMCSLAMRENIIAAQRTQYGKYAAAAIVTEGAANYGAINEDFIESYFDPRYISDYYAFSERPAGADILALSSDLFSMSTFRFDGALPFDLMIYSDIEKSTHFRIGDRRIKEGRFAENISECNVSEELAELNGLTVGDYIETFIYPRNSVELKLEIVGIYEDYTDEISNELILVDSKYKALRVNEYGHPSYLERIAYASEDSISRNQILTVIPTSEELKFIDPFYVNHGIETDNGYDAAIYFAHDEKSLLSFAGEVGDSLDSLPEPFVVLDSGNTLRAVLHILESVESSFTRLLVIVVSFSVFLCAFIIFFILRERTYDIGVFRTRGMSKGKTAFLLSGEVFTVSAIAFTAAFTIYIMAFKRIADSLIHFGDVFILYGGDNAIRVQNTVLGHEIFLPLTPFGFFGGFLATVSLSAIAALAAVLFISRHEPMKTMTEY